ncbi:hypothetical protein DFJ74DRAFT_668097 [Hyaloraphidium curvatum]|nr:hypothetical protein DFJ74DRAFT_668097 [Hyaloraphidium curvatum]
MAAPFELQNLELLSIFPYAVSAPASFPRSLSSDPEKAYDLEGTPPEKDAVCHSRAVDHFGRHRAAPTAGLTALPGRVRACVPWLVNDTNALVCALVATFTTIATSASLFRLNDGTFGTRQLAAGVFSIGAVYGAALVLQLVARSISLRKVGMPTSYKRLVVSLTQLCRWLDVCASGTPSKLVEHVAKDRFRACRDCCSGVVDISGSPPPNLLP